jgi:hypothetical protein
MISTRTELDLAQLEQDFREYLSNLHTDYMTSSSEVDLMLLAAIVDARNGREKEDSVYTFKEALEKISERLEEVSPAKYMKSEE